MLSGGRGEGVRPLEDDRIDAIPWSVLHDSTERGRRGAQPARRRIMRANRVESGIFATRIRRKNKEALERGLLKIRGSLEGIRTPDLRLERAMS